jgi:hypothetical protein
MSLLLALTAASENSQSLAVTLDGVAVNASQVAGHSQSIAVTLDGVTVSVSQTVTAFVNTQALSITLDGVVVAASQVLSAGFVDTHDGYWTKKWLAKNKKPKISEVIEFVKEQPQEAIAEVVQEIKKVYPQIDYREVAGNVRLQKFIAEQLLQALKTRKDDEDMMDFMMMI